MSRVSARMLSLSFMAIMGGVGAFGPFLGLVLDRLGHSAAVIGGLLALVPVTRIASTPLWAMVADKYRAGTRILQFATMGTMLVALAIATERLDAVAIGGVLVFFAFVRAPVGPVIDGLTVRSLEEAGRPASDYGPIRLWGSVAFLAVAGVTAVVATHVAWAVAPMAVAALAWAVGLLVLLRLPRMPSGPPVRLGPALRALAKQPGIGWIVFALPLHGLGLNAYDSWYALHVAELGLPSTWTGIALALGVSMEVGVMALSARVLRNRDPASLVALGMLVAAVRWGLTAVVVNPWLLTLLQALHGLVFAVFWLGVVELFRRVSAVEVRASAQAVVMTACYGLGPLLASLVGGLFVDDHGTSALFWVASGAAGIGALLTFMGGRRLRLMTR